MRKHTIINLLKETKKKNLVIAEIGVWQGALVKKIGKNCREIISEYWGIDLFQRSNHRSYRNIDDDTWDTAYWRACRLMRWFPEFHILRMPSIKAFKLFPPKYFDFIFIDADHSYKGVMADINAWLPLVKDGGLLTGHDYGGKRKHPGVKKAVDECFDKIELLPGKVWVKRL